MVFLISPERPSWAEPRTVKAHLILSPRSARPGETVEAEIRAHIAPGWHVNTHMPSEDFLRPTTLTIAAPSGIRVGEVKYPEPVQKKFSFTPVQLAVYRGKISLRTHLIVGQHVAAGTVPVRAVLRYQACTDTRCLPPRSMEISAPLAIR